MVSKEQSDPGERASQAPLLVTQNDTPENPPPAYEALPPYSANPAASSSAAAALAAASTTEKKQVLAQDTTSGYLSLSLTDDPLDLPNPDTCTAHLKLLYAFRALREDVGYSDGLWGIADPAEDSKAPEVSLDVMSKLREKRWAIYLARAVHRYEAWWVSLGGREVTLGDMNVKGGIEYEMFPFEDVGAGIAWEEKMLMPLDVLMVWHTHMLNPRAYLEDCIRSGHRALWHRGLPWLTVNAAIDDISFEYTVSDEARRRWELSTGLPWENSACPMTKGITCPACSTDFEVPWTTWDPNTSQPTETDFAGQGYGDGDFLTICPDDGCSSAIRKETMYAAKFVRDVDRLLKDGIPMPGTLLDLPTGMPSFDDKGYGDYSFPNELIRRQLSTKVPDLFKTGTPVTMQTVKGLIGDALKDLQPLSDLDGIGVGNGKRLFLKRHSRMATRKMLSRYNGNHSAMALDLAAAVLRQAAFIDKMVKLDWLHSPAVTKIMARNVTKYTRFIDIMARFPLEMAVPTLDVDLAWHTAQLTPAAYFLYTTERCKKFINHDDKVGDITLRDAFEKTSKKYQKLYSEVYSECTCWYCEVVRAGHASGIGGSFGLSSQDRISDAFHASGAVERCPPDNSAHISAHNSVAVASVNRAQNFRKARLEFEFERAQKRAAKKGRKVELKKQDYDHWGKTCSAYSPWVPLQHFYPALYQDGSPATVDHSACAQNACGGNIGNGVCGGPGGCGNCGTDGTNPVPQSYTGAAAFGGNTACGGGCGGA